MAWGDEGAEEEAVESAYGIGKSEYERSIPLVEDEERNPRDFVTNLVCDLDRLKLAEEKQSSSDERTTAIFGVGKGAMSRGRG